MSVNKINCLIFFFIFYFLISGTTLSLIKDERFNCHENQITLKVKSAGTQQILNNNGKYEGGPPTKVYLNDVNITFTSEFAVNVIDENSTIKMVWDNLLSTTYYMFYNLSNIVELDFSSFDFSLVSSAAHMFENCTSLVSLDLSNCNASKIEWMGYMFSNCISLISLNLSDFNTKSLQGTTNMFQGCSSLKYLDISNFDTSKVNNMISMFDGCKNLVSLNLSNFNTQSVKDIQNMFRGCESLESLDLSSFEANLIQNMSSLFEDCRSLEYINLLNFKEKSDLTVTDIFKNIKENFVICINEENNTKIKSEIPNKVCGTIDCSVNWKESTKRIVVETGECLINKLCNSTGYKYEYNNRCYSSCPNGTFPYDNYLCENISEIITGILPTTILRGMTRIVTTIKEITPTTIIDIIKNIINSNNNKTEKEINELIVETIEIYFTSKDYNLPKLEKGEIEKIEINNEIITLTTTKNEINQIENNNSTNIILGECENKLRKYYTIPNETLFIIKIETIPKDINMTKINFDVYRKLSTNLTKLNLSVCENIDIYLSIPLILDENIDKLNKSSRYYNDICYPATSDNGTDIIIKDRQKEFIKRNQKVCQEDCYFSHYNYELQKANCTCTIKQIFSSFTDLNINKTKLYENFKNFKNIANTDILSCYKELFKSKNIIFNIGSYLTIIVFLLHIICSILFYMKEFQIFLNQIKLIILDTTNIKPIKKENDKGKNNEKEKEKGIISLYKNKTTNKKKIQNSNNICNSNILNYNNNQNINITKKSKKLNRKKYNHDSEKKMIQSPKLDLNDDYINKHERNEKRSKTIIKNESKNKFLINESQLIKEEKEKIIVNYIEEEKNKLSYDLAKQYDYRTYCEYYISLLKTKHNLFFTFFNNNDYNSKIIKIDLFFNSFIIYYALNAAFFDDNLIHRIYEDKGSLDYIYQLPKIFYSFFISMVLNILLKLLALSSNDVIELKNKKFKNNINRMNEYLNSKIKIKFISFFIISYIFLLFFWYYLSMFCAIYKNSQYHLIKETLISFALSMLYPFVINLLPGIFRIPSLSDSKNKKKCLYNFSKVLQLL